MLLRLLHILGNAACILILHTSSKRKPISISPWAESVLLVLEKVELCSLPQFGITLQYRKEGERRVQRIGLCMSSQGCLDECIHECCRSCWYACHYPLIVTVVVVVVCSFWNTYTSSSTSSAQFFAHSHTPRATVI